MSVLGLLALGAGFAAARGMPNRFERRYRRQVKDMGKKLSRGEGGMSEAERQQALARGSQQVQAATAQQQAQLSRGSASGAGASGMRQQAIRDLGKSRTQAMGQMSSAVNQQDLALRDAMKQQYIQGLRDISSRSDVRRDKALNTAQQAAPTIQQAAYAKGAERRQAAGMATTSAAPPLMFEQPTNYRLIQEVK